MPDRAAGRTWAAPAGVAVITLFAIATRAGMLGGPQIDYDEGVYWQSLRALAAGHPLFSSVYSSQPPGFLLLLTPFYDILGHSLAGARVGVALFSLLGIAAAYVASSSLAGRSAGLMAAAILVADPLYLRQSVTVQADGPAVALALCAVAAAAVGRGSHGNRSVAFPLASGALLGLASTVKLLALPALLPVVLLLAPSRSRVGAAAVGAGLAVSVVLLPFVGDLGLVARQSVGLHLSGSAGSLTSAADLWSLARWEIPLTIAAGISLVVHRPRRDLLIATAWLGLALAALIFIRPLWPHHLLVVSVPMALLAAPLVADLAKRRSVLLLVGALAAGGSSVAIVISQQLTTSRSAIDRLAQLTRPGEEVITDDPFGAALADRDTPPELVDTSLVRIRSGDLTLATLERIAARDRIRILVLASGRLVQLPGLRGWTAGANVREESIGGETFLEFP